MKGIILAGGAGTRLHPLTLVMSKQMMPVYDKPMIYYPLSTLIYSGIREILIISTPNDLPIFKKLLGDGSRIGCKLEYKVQKEPNGLAQAFIIGEEFIGSDKVCMILGDNIFQMKINTLSKCKDVDGGIVFGYHVHDPERYGVAQFDSIGNVLTIEEKPKNPKSNYAVVGLYFYPNDVIKIAENIKPSSRGELEITSVNKEYLNRMQLKVEIMERGFAWLDTGTHDSLSEASEFVKALEKRQGLMIACLEEIALEQGYIDKKQVMELGKEMNKTDYGKYIINRANKWK